MVIDKSTIQNGNGKRQKNKKISKTCYKTTMGRVTVIVETGERVSTSLCAIKEPMRALQERMEAKMAPPSGFTKIFSFFFERPNNIVMSPSSVELFLLLMLRGAANKTAAEIAEALEPRRPRDIVTETFDTLLLGERMARRDNFLKMTNKVFYDTKYFIEARFKSIARAEYFTDFQKFEFSAQPAQTLRELNLWMDKEFGGKFKFFTPMEIPPETEMVLMNIIYFKGKWKYRFYSERTKKLPFFTLPNSSKLVDMLTNVEYYGYRNLRSIGAKMLVMPYVGDRIALVIILPDDTDGIEEVESKLPAVNIMKEILLARHPQVQVWIPCFKFECTVDLTEDLKTLGVNNLFDTNSVTLPQVSKNKECPFVSRIIQKTMIEVTEQCSKVHENLLMIPERVTTSGRHEFKVDHPFIFYIVNTELKSFLLIGRVKAV